MYWFCFLTAVHRSLHIEDCCSAAACQRDVVSNVKHSVLLVPPNPAGCHAARPLTEPTTTKSGRKLLSVNWGGFSCAGLRDIGFSTSSKALSLPVNGLIMGQVQIHNRGYEPFEFETPGFRLSGVAGNMDGMMKCPQQEVPAGGSMQVRGGRE